MVSLGYVLVGTQRHHVGPKTKRCRCWRVMRLPRVPLARGNAPEDHGRRFAERLPNSRAGIGRLHASWMLVLGCGSVLKSDEATTKATASASVSRTCLVVRQGAAVASDATFRERSHAQALKFLGWLHPGKQLDLAAITRDLFARQFSRRKLISTLCDSTRLEQGVRGIRSRRH